MKKIFVLFISLCIFIPFINIEAEENKNILAPNAKSAILIESSTGEVIYEYNSHEKLEPASMTKMMTLLRLVLEHLEMVKSTICTLVELFFHFVICMEE